MSRLGVLFALLCGCRGGVLGTDVVARVDGAELSKGAYEAQVARALRRYGEERPNLPDGVLARLQDVVLRQMVDACIVERRAEVEGIAVGEGELEEALEQHRARFRDPEAFADYLARANTTPAALKEELRHSLVRDRVLDKVGGKVEVSQEEVRRFYEENPDHFVQAEHARAHRLMLRYPSDASDARRHKVRQRAHSLHAQARRERHDAQAFVALCRRHGDGPEAERGGELGPLPVGRAPELDRAIAAGLQAGEFTDVVDVEHGVAFYRLDGHTPRQRQPLGEVAASIRTDLALHARNARRQEVLQQLRQAAKVEVFVGFEPRPRPATQTTQPADGRIVPPSKAPAVVPHEAAAPRQEVGVWSPNPARHGPSARTYG